MTGGDFQTAIFRVQGLDCAEEAGLLKKALAPLGPARLSFDLMNATMTVRAERLLDEAAVVRVAAKVGLTARKLEPGQELEPLTGCSCGACGACGTSGPGFWAGRGQEVMAGLSGILYLAGAGLHWGLGGAELVRLAPWPWAGAALAGLWFVIPKVLASLRVLGADMNLLMTLAVLGAGVLNDWFEAASTGFLFSLALLLETWSMKRARRSIRELLNIAPKTAKVLDLTGGEGTETPVGRVAVGSLVLVRPGEAVPLDGVVTMGESRVNQAALTGEPEPVYKGPGATVFAGTVNGEGLLTVRTTKPAQDTAISRIMRLVQEAQSRRAKVARWVDRFAAVYTPAVMAFALLVAVIPPLAGLGTFSDWIMRSLVVLLAACPCALAISTPVSIVAGLTSAMRQGVLIKGGAYLEVAAGIQAVTLDKTGTLTLAKPSVVKAVAAPGHALDELSALAASLEAHAGHPAGLAVHEYALAAGGQALPVLGLTSLPGLGVKGEIGGVVHYAGSPRLYERVFGRAFSLALLGLGQEAEAPQALIFTAQGLIGGFVLQDALRPESLAAVAGLKGLVDRVVMLTGDAREPAERMAAMAGIEEIYFGLSPKDKADLVGKLRQAHGRVAMVGDGVNDAPALGAADLGVAMGLAGTGAAMETADVGLMSDDLAKLPWLIAHARRTLTVVRQNIVFALGLKAVFIALALSGLATLWMAVVADTGVSLLVIANGLRLLRAGPN